MAENAEPQAGDSDLRFNGRDAYVEIPSIDDYSVSTTGEFTVSAWMRPNTLNFPSVERNSDYIHWLGKGDASGAGRNQEWTFRMYNHHDPRDAPPRPNRISFYLFNPRVDWVSVVSCRSPSTRENGFHWSGSPTPLEPTSIRMANTFAATHIADPSRARARSIFRILTRPSNS